MSEVKVDSIGPRVDSGTLTIGAAGDTVNIAGTAGTGFPTPTTGIAASAITTGTMATARLGSGTASSSTFLRGDQTYATPSGGDNTPIFRAYQNSAQSINNATYTLVNFQAENFDPDSTFNVSNGRFTPAVAGYYFIHAGIRIDTSNDMVTLACNIRKNASAIIRHTSVSQNYGNSQASILVYSDTDDYFDVQVYQDAGGSQNLSANSDDTFFEAFKVIT